MYGVPDFGSSADLLPHEKTTQTREPTMETTGPQAGSDAQMMAKSISIPPHKREFILVTTVEQAHQRLRREEKQWFKAEKLALTYV